FSACKRRKRHKGITVPLSVNSKGHGSSVAKDGSRDEIHIFGSISARPAGMSFDVSLVGSRRINGMRNFRQALASPHSVVPSTDSARPLRDRTLGGNHAPFRADCLAHRHHVRMLALIAPPDHRAYPDSSI